MFERKIHHSLNLAIKKWADDFFFVLGQKRKRESNRPKPHSFSCPKIGNGFSADFFPAKVQNFRLQKEKTKARTFKIHFFCRFLFSEIFNPGCYYLSRFLSLVFFSLPLVTSLTFRQFRDDERSLMSCLVQISIIIKMRFEHAIKEEKQGKLG